MDYDKLSPMVSRMGSRPSHKIIGVGIVMVVILYVANQFSGHQIPTSTLLTSTATADTTYGSNARTVVAGRVEAEFEPIPNIVHYVWILNQRQDNMRLGFEHFLSLYAASTLWNPDKIYIHTDIPEGKFLPEAGAESPSDKWNILIANTSNVEINHIIAPALVPGTNKTITRIEHKSDFIRLQMMRRYGGVYLDWDAHPLRDIKPLRYSGFKAIVGREPSHRVQTGTYMATKDSLLMKIWSEKMSLSYDGTWARHSNRLLTYLAPRIVSHPREVLIMEQDAFTPGDFTTPSYNRFYDTHFDSPIQDLSDMWEGLFDRYDEPNRWPKWHINYDATYVLHVFGLQRAHKDLVLNNGYTELTPEYVLARQSNAARALYPTARRMVEQSLIVDPYAE